MGFLDELKKLTRPYDEDDEMFDSEANLARSTPRYTARGEEPAQAERRTSFFAEKRPEEQEAEARPYYPPPRKEKEPRQDSSKVFNVGASQQRVVLITPRVFDDAVGIANHLKDRHTVVMNLENTEKTTARRLIDFLSGVAYAQDGKIKKVSGSIFLIMPYNVDLMGDLVDDIENSNQIYF
ncbi:MAG: cell division protein SepF [Ruminococcaceae bacterium]|nr:cell division protein SepF [Oscillospiraceae bacterium]